MFSGIFFMSVWVSSLAFVHCDVLSVKAPTGVDSRSANITCTVKLQNNDTFKALSWKQKKKGPFEKYGANIASLYITSVSINGLDRMRKRIDLIPQNNFKQVILKISPVVCWDEGFYAITLCYYKSGDKSTCETDEVEFDVEVPASITTTRPTIFKDQFLTAECEGDLGKPNGTLSWYILDQTGHKLSLDNQDTKHFITQDSCSTKVRSTITIKQRPEIHTVQCQTFNKHNGMSTVDEECAKFPDACVRIPVSQSSACDIQSSTPEYQPTCIDSSGTLCVSLPMAFIIASVSIIVTILVLTLVVLVRCLCMKYADNKRKQTRSNTYESATDNRNLEERQYDRISGTSSYIICTSVHGTTDN